MGNDGRDNDAKKAYEGVLNIEQKFGTEKRSGAKVSAFVDRIKKRMKQEPFNVDFPENRTVSNYYAVFFTFTLGGIGSPLHLTGVLMVSFGEKIYELVSHKLLKISEK